MGSIKDVAAALQVAKEEKKEKEEALKKAEDAVKSATEKGEEEAKLGELQAVVNAAKFQAHELMTTLCETAALVGGDEGGKSARGRSRSRSRDKQLAATMQSLGKAIKQAGKAKREGGESSSSESEEDRDATPKPELRDFLSTFHLEDISVEELPKGNVRRKLLKTARKNAKKKKLPFIGNELGSKFVAAKDLTADWAKGLDKAGGSFSMAQFSALWWRRSILQIVAQAESRVQTISLGDIVERWLVLSRIACQESVGTAVAYDKATWTEADAKIEARDVSFHASELTQLRENKLAEVMRLRNGGGGKGAGKGGQGKDGGSGAAARKEDGHEGGKGRDAPFRFPPRREDAQRERASGGGGRFERRSDGEGRNGGGGVRSGTVRLTAAPWSRR